MEQTIFSAYQEDCSRGKQDWSLLLFMLKISLLPWVQWALNLQVKGHIVQKHPAGTEMLQWKGGKP